MVTRGTIAQRETNTARTIAGGKLRTIQVPRRVPGQGNGVQGSKQNDCV